MIYSVDVKNRVSYNAFKELARYYMSLFEGDTHNIEKAMALMEQLGLLDQYGQLVEDEE